MALGFLWLPLGSQVIPDLLTHLVADDIKGTSLAVLEGIGTLAAFFVQPIMGALSDRTQSRWGRRRPYIVVGTLGSCLFLVLMTVAGSFWWLLGLYFLLQVSENTAQGPYQGLLPDVVPENERSTASGFVGAGNLTGLLLGTVVVGTFLTQKPPNFTGALLSMVVVLMIAMTVVTTVVPDRARPVAGARRRLREVIVGTFNIDRRKHRDFLWLMVSRLLILVAIAGLQSFAFFFFKDVFYRGADPNLEAAANGATRDLLAVILVFALLSTIPAARISHRVGRRPLIVLAGILGAIATVGIVLSPYAILPGAMLRPVADLFHVSPRPLPIALLRDPGRHCQRHIPGGRLGLPDGRDPHR